MRNWHVLVLVTLFTVGCDKIDELTKFDLDYNTSVVIESSVGVNLPFNVFTPQIETNSESEFAVNDTRKDLIEEIKLKRLNLIITDPEKADFSFLESIEIYISAEGLDEIKIASLEMVPKEAGSIIDLDTFDIDLKDYIKKDEFSLRLNTVTDELIASDYHIAVNSVFFVDAKILGL